MIAWRRPLILLLLGWTMAVTISRSVRFANDFAEAHWLLTYQFGFLKRALPGELLARTATLVRQPITEGVLRTVTVSIFALFCGALVWLALRILRRAEWSTGSALVLAAFLCSPFIVLSAHFLGYFDQLVLLIAIASIALAMREYRWTSSLLMAAAVFVHEAAIVVAFPAWCLVWLVGPDRVGAARWSPRRLAPLAVPLAAFALLSYAQTRIDPDEFVRSAAVHLHNFPFVQRGMDGAAPMWLAQSFGGYARQSHRFAERVGSPHMHGLMLPVMLALLAATIETLQRRTPVTLLAIAGVAAAPLLMHLSAWDTARIWSMSIATCFLAWWVVTEQGDPQPLSPAIRLLGLAGLISGVVLVSPLMDDLSERYTLAERLWWYTPSLVAAIALLRIGESTPAAGTAAGA